MAAEPVVVPANADDVAYFAARRYQDEHGRDLYRDLAQIAPSGAFVAKDEGTPVGIGFAHACEDEWFLSELFVEPSFRSSGLGLRLLQEAAGNAGEATRSGIVQAAELGGIAFFLRRGVSLQTPVLELAGEIPHENELARMAAGEYRFRTEPLDPIAHRAALAQFDRDVRGSARPQDHRYFSQRAQGFIFARDAEIAGYGYVWPSGRIGPMLTASSAYAVQFLAFSLAALRSSFGASWCTLLVPGSNLRVLRASMIAGLRIETVRLFASDAGMTDLSRYVGFHALLF